MEHHNLLFGDHLHETTMLPWGHLPVQDFRSLPPHHHHKHRRSHNEFLIQIMLPQSHHLPCFPQRQIL